MRRSQVLLQQHVGRMFREKWKVQGKRVLIDSGALKELKLRGIAVEDANEVVKDKTHKTYVELEKFLPQVIQMDENHPDYHEEPCLIYSDHNVLLGGFDQAKVFTNSCEMSLETLPLMERLKDNQNSHLIDDLVKRCIKASLLFDATQEKLPKKKDPERPAFVFPRDYGITAKRKNFLLGKRLLQLCLALNPELLSQRRLIAGPIRFQASLQRNENNVLLSNAADVLVTSNENIKSIINPAEVVEAHLPSIYPLSPLVSFERHHIYNYHDDFPINENAERSQVHTVLIHFDKSEVSNLYETEVTESQILARSLMNCYTIALSEARRCFGKDVMDLPKPITVQSLQMDSKTFHYSVLQLNTTAGPEDTTTRNAYWSIPSMPLFEICDYVEGRPELEGYNPNVFHTLLTFFRNN